MNRRDWYCITSQVLTEVLVTQIAQVEVFWVVTL